MPLRHVWAEAAPDFSWYASDGREKGNPGQAKWQPVYSQTVLSHDQRIALDDAPVETVDAEVKAWQQWPGT
jgi:hypothetical protein